MSRLRIKRKHFWFRDPKIVLELSISEYRFDAIVVNDTLGELNYRQLEAFLEKLLFLTRQNGIVQVRQYVGDSKLNLAHCTDLFDSFRVNEPNGKHSYGFKIQWEQGLRDTIYVSRPFTER